jgi:hypothetical protein
MSRYTIKMRAGFENAVSIVTEALGQQGFRVIRSFDLSSALDADDPACSCPHHGTERCTCRYTVLLVYSIQTGVAGDDAAPRAIIVHTQDAETFLTVSSLEDTGVESGSNAAAPEHALVRGLVEASLTVPPASLNEASS